MKAIFSFGQVLVKFQRLTIPRFADIKKAYNCKPHIQELTNVQREAAKIDFQQEKKKEYGLTT